MSNERTERMARAYVEDGLSYTQIAEEFGLTKQRVGQLLGPLGLARDHGQRSRAMREQALRAAHGRIMAGRSTLEEEAGELGYNSAGSLRSVLYRMGLRVVHERLEPAHGTVARYRRRNDPCRCDECRRANREKLRELQGQEPPHHGYSGYINYGCRCQVCSEEHRTTIRARRVTKRRKKEVVV